MTQLDLTILEALKNYHRDFDHWLNMCGGDPDEVNFYTSGTPAFDSLEDARAYYHQLGELVAHAEWEHKEELKNA